MGILRPAKNETAYLKAGILGFEGSGKTYTAALIAIGLAQKIGDGRPVAFFDTETGSDYLIQKFRDAGVELLVAKTRAFADLLAFVEEAEDSCSVAIVDSVTHTWTELVETSQSMLNVSRLGFHHWGPIKREWSRFTTAFINSRLHLIVCGRAGFEYDYQKDAEGELELVKTGTKMRAEGQLAYEPSLLLEMEKYRERGSRTTVPRCYVLKDRADLMMGREIDWPKFEDFLPVVEFLNIGGTHVGVDESRSSARLVHRPDWSGRDNRKTIEITLDEIKAVFVRQDLDGTKQAVKKERQALLEMAFGSASWTAIEGLDLRELWEGYRKLRLKFDPACKIPDAPGLWETPKGEPIPRCP